MIGVLIFRITCQRQTCCFDPLQCNYKYRYSYITLLSNMNDCPPDVRRLIADMLPPIDISRRASCNKSPFRSPSSDKNPHNQPRELIGSLFFSFRIRTEGCFDTRNTSDLDKGIASGYMVTFDRTERIWEGISRLVQRLTSVQDHSNKGVTIYATRRCGTFRVVEMKFLILGTLRLVQWLGATNIAPLLLLLRSEAF